MTAAGLSSAAHLGIVVTVAGLFVWLIYCAQCRLELRQACNISAADRRRGVGSDRLGPLFAGGVILVVLGLALTMPLASK